MNLIYQKNLLIKFLKQINTEVNYDTPFYIKEITGIAIQLEAILLNLLILKLQQFFNKWEVEKKNKNKNLF